MKLVRRVLVTAGLSAVICLLVGTPAFAELSRLNPAQIGSTAADFANQDCSGPLANPPGPNYDG